MAPAGYAFWIWLKKNPLAQYALAAVAAYVLFKGWLWALLSRTKREAKEEGREEVIEQIKEQTDEAVERVEKERERVADLNESERLRLAAKSPNNRGRLQDPEAH
jgi:hypothetical protein